MYIINYLEQFQNPIESAHNATIVFDRIMVSTKEGQKREKEN